MFNALFDIKQIYLNHKQTVEKTLEGDVISTHITSSNDFIPFLQESTKLKSEKFPSYPTPHTQ